MKRKIFFWLEKLKISPAERKAVTAAMALLLLLAGLNYFTDPGSPYGEAFYGPLEEEFRRRTREMERKEAAVLARYYPDTADTVRLDSSSVNALPKININAADATLLQRLPGIGPVYADRIVRYRRENGSFKSYSELLNIKGIGKKRLEKLLPFIQLKKSKRNQ